MSTLNLTSRSLLLTALIWTASLVVAFQIGNGGSSESGVLKQQLEMHSAGSGSRGNTSSDGGRNSRSRAFSETRRTGMTKLTSEVFFKERGEEIFRAYALPDADLDWLQIASGRIQVWPIADVEILGMDENQKITRSLPNITVNLKDLYPDSTTSVQIYKGTPALGQDGDQIQGAKVSFNSIVPQDAQILVRNWDRYAEDDGVYTIEVITLTPFDGRTPERLAWLTFEVDRTISMKGSATTSE